MTNSRLVQESATMSIEESNEFAGSSPAMRTILSEEIAKVIDDGEVLFVSNC